MDVPGDVALLNFGDPDVQLLVFQLDIHVEVEVLAENFVYRKHQKRAQHEAGKLYYH